jgi:hypothetical protein
MNKWLLGLLICSWIWWIAIMVFCTGCITITENLATGHAKETITEKKENDTSTKVDSEIEGKGSLFGF